MARSFGKRKLILTAHETVVKKEEKGANDSQILAGEPVLLLLVFWVHLVIREAVETDA